MSKPKHRKNHKKKLAQRRMKIEHAKNRYNKKLKELYGAEIAKLIANSENNKTNNITEE
jgi:hypothetical protein